MRDPKRIPIIMAGIQREWELHPNWRFGQLIFNLFQATFQCREPIFFQLEDDVVENWALGPPYDEEG